MPQAGIRLEVKWKPLSTKQSRARGVYTTKRAVKRKLCANDVSVVPQPEMVG